MTIQQCKYVLEIVKTGSFNEAAKQLFVAQSALSSSVKLLENELNIKIFERSKNGVFLTYDGAEFVRYAEELVEQEKFITERYRSDGEKKRLYVVSQHYDFVADVFCSLLREEVDGCDFSLKELKTYEVIREVESAYSDIGIIAIKDGDFDIMKRYLGQRGLVFTPFLKAEAHVFVRKNHTLAGLEKISHGDLADFPFLLYEQGAHNNSFFSEEIECGFDSARRVRISDRATLMNVLLTTDCYTVGTGVMPSALNDGKIVSLPLDSTSFYSIGYILRADRKKSGLCERFITLLNDFSQNYPRKC